MSGQIFIHKYCSNVEVIYWTFTRTLPGRHKETVLPLMRAALDKLLIWHHFCIVLSMNKYTCTFLWNITLNLWRLQVIMTTIKKIKIKIKKNLQWDVYESITAIEVTESCRHLSITEPDRLLLYPHHSQGDVITSVYSRYESDLK